jgi:hypothetical protein
MRIDFPVGSKPERAFVHFRLKSRDTGAFETVEINSDYPGLCCRYGLSDKVVCKRGKTVIGKQIEARCDAIRLFLKGLDCVYRADK